MIVVKKLFAAFLLAVFACQARAECQLDDTTMEVFRKNCPLDIAEIVERINACRHFGSEPYDLSEEWGRERKEFLDKKFSELRCRDLEVEQEAIEEKYKQNPQLRSFLREHSTY